MRDAMGMRWRVEDVSCRVLTLVICEAVKARAPPLVCHSAAAGSQSNHMRDGQIQL